MAPKAATAPRGSTSSIFREAPAFSSFSVRDIKPAKKFYGDLLGLRVSETQEGLELTHPNGNTVFLYPKPNHSPASFTVLNFPVKDINDAVDSLELFGIKLERYNQPDLKTDDRGIFHGSPGPTIAWFKDPDGNILSVVEA